MEKISVLIVDDHPVFRAGLARWIAGQPDLVCCGEAGSLAAAAQAVAERRPDIILLDLRLGCDDGLELARRSAEAPSAPRIVVLSQNDDDASVERAFKAGVRGYVVKSEATEFVLEAIRTVLRGELYLNRPAAARLLQKLDDGTGTDLGRLTEREKQVLQLLGAGRATGEIAERLGISPKTVDTYREHLKDKLGLPDGAALRGAAVRWVETGRIV